MKTKFEQIVDITKIGQNTKIDMNTVFAMAEKENLKQSSEDSIKRLLLCIEVEKDFIEGGALEVPGSIKDVENITRFIYNNMENITNIMCSLDTHVPAQIFHPCWWINSANEHPKPYTIITYEDIINGYWSPAIGDKNISIEYVKELEKADSGKRKLCIWPYHCICGTEGATLENEFAKIVYFHSVARKTKNPIIPKGTDPYSEMYGIIKPEYSRTNFVNTEVLSAIEEYDEIYIVGEASSHCVLESVKQIVEYYKNQPEITNKIIVLEDCTSPITGHELVAIEEFKKLKNLYGIKFAKSSDIII